MTSKILIYIHFSTFIYIVLSNVQDNERLKTQITNVQIQNIENSLKSSMISEDILSEIRKYYLSTLQSQRQGQLFFTDDDVNVNARIPTTSNYQIIKSQPKVFQNGTIELGFKIQNKNNISPVINTYQIKNIEIKQHPPVIHSVNRVRVTHHDGDVSKEIFNNFGLGNAGNMHLFQNYVDHSKIRNAVQETNVKVSKIAFLRKKGINLRNATSKIHFNKL